MRQQMCQAAVILSLGALIGCAGAQQVERAPLPPAQAPAWMEGCLMGLEGRCDLGAATSARMHDRAMTGQALVQGSAEAPQDTRRQVATLGAWLNPRPWVSDAVAPHLPPGLEVPEVDLPAGATLVFEGAAAPTGGRAVPIPHTLPDGDGPWGGAELAARVAAAHRGVAAVWRGADGQSLLAPATPLHNTLLGMPIGPLPARAEGATAWARELTEADDALNAGEPWRAYAALQRALALTPEDAPACRVRGALRMVTWQVGTLNATADAEDLDLLQRDCTADGATADPAEARAATYLRELAFLEAQASRRGNPAEQADALYTPKQREAWRARLEALAQGPLAGRQGDLLLAMTDEVIAASLEPQGPCDDTLWTRIRRDLDSVAARYRDLGRDDLAAAIQSGALVDSQRRLQTQELQRALDYADQPQNMWIRQRILNASLNQAAFSTRPPDAAATVTSLCTRTLEAAQREVELDREAGAPERNASRLFAAVGGVVACPQEEPLQRLTDTILQAGLQSQDSQADVLLTLYYAGFQMIGALFGGRGGDAARTVSLVRDGLTRVQTRLTAEPPDRALSAILGVVVTALDLAFQGQGDLGEELRRARATLQEIAAQPPPQDAPEILRLAPALHLALIGLDAAWSLAQSDDAHLQAALRDLDASLEQDLERLLAAYGADAYRPAFTRLARSAHRVLTAASADSPDTAAMEAAAQDADTPDPAETRWWRVGLELGRVALWDIAGKRDRAEATLSRLIEAALDDFELRNTGWELLSLAPAAHRAILTFTLDDNPDDTALQTVGHALQGSLDSSLKRLSPALRDASAQEIGPLAALIDMLEVTQDVGPDRLVRDAAGRRAWAERWAERSKAYPDDLRAVAKTLTGALLFDDANTAPAAAHLQQAAQLTQGTPLQRVSYAPLLLQASLLARTPQNHQAALSELDKAFVFTQEARSCDKTHEVEAALPAQAHLLAAAGRYDEADVVLGRYLNLIQKGFSGDATLQCQLVAYKPNFTLRMELKQSIQALFFNVNAEGDLSISAGFEGHSRDNARLMCASNTTDAARHDLELNAWLLRAAIALRAGKDKEAHLALLGANDVAYRLIYGSPLTLDGPSAAGMEGSREKAYLKLLGWVAAYAHAAGHVGPADNLKLVGAQLLKARESSWAEALDGEAPPHLQGLGFEHAGPLAAAWLPLESPEGLKAYEAALKKLAAPNTPITPEAVPVLLAKAHRELDPQAAAPTFKKLKVPRTDTSAKRVFAAAHLLAALDADPAKAPLQPLLDLVGDLAAAGHFGDITELVARASNILWSNQRQDDTLTLTRKAAAVIPPARAPRALGMMLLWLANIDGQAASSDPAWAARIAQVAPSLHGTIDPELELRVLYTAAAGLAADKRFDLMKTPVRLLRQLAERGFGPQNPLTVNVQLMDLCLDALRDEIDLDALREIEANARDVQDLDPTLKKLLQRMTEVCQEPAPCRELGQAYFSNYRR